MPFNKQKLATDIENALGRPIPADDDRARAAVRKCATELATAIEAEPTVQVLANEELIKLLQNKVNELEARVQELQDFINTLDARVVDVESKIPAGSGGGVGA